MVNAEAYSRKLFELIGEKKKNVLFRFIDNI